MSARAVRIPGHQPEPLRVAELPAPALRLAVVLSTATRIEPELIRAMRVRVRPTLDVGAESGLWFGRWANRNGPEYMAIRRPLLAPLRDLLRAELAESGERDAVRQAGEVILRAHTGRLSPTLLLEEHVTWAAVLADAGLGTDSVDDPWSAVDRLLEGALRAALEAPERREGLRRWFTGAWQRFPEQVRLTPTALDLFELLHGDDAGSPSSAASPSSTGSAASPSSAGSARAVPPTRLADIRDVVLSVRHDGSHVTIGDPRWPAEGILVPDTQPRILEITHDLTAWEDALKLRVPRGGRATVPVSHVPVFVRTRRGDVYRLGHPADREAVGHPSAATERGRDRGLLGTRIADLTDADAARFGIAPLLAPGWAGPGPRRHWSDLLRTELTPHLARPGDPRLRGLLGNVQGPSRLLVLTGIPSSGRTRTAWEAMRRALPDWWVWCPPLIDRAQALMDAVGRDQLGSQTVLWLDDLDTLLDDPATGEDVAGTLTEVLTDPARSPLLLLATAALTPGRKGTGPRGRALLGQAMAVDARTGRMNPDGSSFPEVPPSAGDWAIASAVAGQPRHRPGLRSRLPARPHPAGFVGRSRQLGALHDLLGQRDGAAAFAVVAGLSGVGKTALAAETVHRAREDRGWFPGGVLWLTLDGAPLTPSLLLRALGLPPMFQPETETARWSLCSVLLYQMTGGCRQPVLLVLDDAPSWHPSDVTALAPGLSVLVTSRGDGPYQPSEPLILGPLEPDDAVALLATALALRDGDGERVVREGAAARRLVELCGRLPLALTVAAGLLADDAGLTLATLADAVERAPVSVDVLTHGDRSVRAAFDLSYRELNSTQSLVFRLLALVPGATFSTATAAAVLDRPPERMVRGLVRMHLVRRTGEEGRWRMPALVRQYAADLGKLHAVEDRRAEAFERLTLYYQRHARDADAWMREDTGPKGSPFFSSRQQAVEWLTAERRSLVAMVDSCLDEGYPESAAAIALALAESLTRAKHFEDLLHVMDAVLTSPGRGRRDQYTRAAALNNFAVAMARRGDFQDAMKALKQAAELHTELGDGSAYALMLGNLGATLLVGKRSLEAIPLLREAADRWQAADAPQAHAQVLGNLGAALLDSGELEQAVTTLRQARELSSQEGVQVPAREQATLLARLGMALVSLGRRVEGVAVLRKAALRADQSGDRRGRAEILQSIGRTLIEAGRFDEAVQCLTETRHSFHQLGDSRGEAQTCNDLGLALLDAGLGTEAFRSLEQARELHLRNGDALGAAQSSHNLGNALRRLGHYGEAMEMLSEAVPELREVGDEAGWAQALLNLGLARLAHGDPAEAAEALQACATAYASLGDIAGRGQALYALGRAAHSLGDPQAVDHLFSANEAFRQGHQGSWLVESLLLLSDILSSTGRTREASEALREALRLKSASLVEGTTLAEETPGSRAGSDGPDAQDHERTGWA
jgi:tetratricopeptide (TPR) repeat protein